jgi:hypothetical protein
MVVKDQIAIFLFGRFMLISCHAVIGFHAEGEGMLSTMMSTIVSDHSLCPGYSDLV